MREVFDAYEYFDYLRKRWRFLGIACVTALLLATIATLFQPRQYMAVTSLIIDVPPGIDPRSAMTVSPIYIESLRTYELYATGDSLFLKALDKFGIRRSRPGMSIEDWKRKILRVEMPRNTKILEIRVTLPDAKVAHDFALFLAEEAVRLNRSMTDAGDSELHSATEERLVHARNSRDQALKDLQDLMRREPLDALESETRALQERLALIDREQLHADQTVAEYAERVRVGGTDTKMWEGMLSVEQARVKHLKGQRQTVMEDLTSKKALLNERSTRFAQAQNRLKAAETGLQVMEAKLQESQTLAGMRTERLRLIDPGVVPERHSSPRLSTNLIASLLAGIVLALLYLSIEFGYQRWTLAQRRHRAVASRHADD